MYVFNINYERIPCSSDQIYNLNCDFLINPSCEFPQAKETWNESFQVENRRYLPYCCFKKGLKGTAEKETFKFFEITFTVSLSVYQPCPPCPLLPYT